MFIDFDGAQAALRQEGLSPRSGQQRVAQGKSAQPWE